MIKTKYNEFINDIDVYEIQKICESFIGEDLVDRISKYLEKVEKKGNIIESSKKIFQYFRSNPKIVIVVIGLLITRFSVTNEEIMRILPFGNSEKIELIKKSTKKNVDKKKAALHKFINKIAQRESSGDPTKINSYGYMGKFQFGKIALIDINKISSKEEYKKFLKKFKKHGDKFWPEHKQDEDMIKLLKNNKKYLGKYVSEYVGKHKNGIKITLSGLLAGAHLLGTKNVKKFLDSGHVSKDANGTPITEYIEKFGGYDLDI